MNEKLARKFYEFCTDNSVKPDDIKQEVVQSCFDAIDAITKIRNKESEPEFNLSRSKNDLLFGIRFGTRTQQKPDFGDVLISLINQSEKEFDIEPVISGLFAKSTSIAKCYDVFNNGKGITLVITYADAIK